MMVSKRKKKYILTLIIIIAVLFICSVGFALLIKNANESRQVPVRDSDISFLSEDSNVTIKGIVSVSDDFGRKIHETNEGAFGYLQFDVVNNSSYDRSYQVYITKKDSEKKDINPTFITFYLTDQMDHPLSGFQTSNLPSYNDLHYLSDKPDCKVLYSGLVKGNTKKQFILRVWIDDSYVVQNEEVEFIFDINARAV